MRPASEEFILDYCEAVLYASSEEELEQIIEEIKAALKEYDYTEEQAENIFNQAEEILKNPIEAILYVNQNRYIISSETQKSVENNTNNTNTNQITLVGGLGLTALMTILALKKKSLKKQIKR